VQELRIARSKAGLTLMELEEASGVGASTISKIERGVTQPQATTLHKLAEALGVEVGELYPKERGPSPEVEVKESRAAAHLQSESSAKPEVIDLLEQVWRHETPLEEAAPKLELVGGETRVHLSPLTLEGTLQPVKITLSVADLQEVIRRVRQQELSEEEARAELVARGEPA
jgi:transcriptional regulator with XRE-family HTH domain